MYNNYFSNFGRPLVPDDLCKDSAPAPPPPPPPPPQRHPWFWRRRFLKVFTIYWHGGNLRSVDHDHFSNLIYSPNLRRLHMKFEQNWLSGFRGEVVWKVNGWKVIAIAHPEHSSGELMTIYRLSMHHWKIASCVRLKLFNILERMTVKCLFLCVCVCVFIQKCCCRSCNMVHIPD